MSHPSSRHGASRILLVEDNVLQREFYAGVLSDQLEVDSVGTLAEAIALLDDPSKYAAVVGDLWLPDGQGLELAEVLRRGDPDIPLVVLTAEPSVETAIGAIEAGVYRFLTKPFPPGRLIEEVLGAARAGRMARLRRKVMQALQARQRPKVRFVPRRVARHVLDDALAGAWLAAQPIVRASNHSIYAYELLLRSDSPLLGNPMAIIDACEQHRCLLDLGRRIRGLAAERAQGLEPGARLFVNLHPQDLLDPNLFDGKDPLLDYAGRITMEITERASLEGKPGAVDAVRNLRRQGYEIAVDDLGAGYSGLTSMVQLQPQLVKLDMSLVRGIDADPTRAALVRGMTEIAQGLGIGVVAEGVETREERDTLIALGCELLQGYFFARPGRGFPTVSPTLFD